MLFCAVNDCQPYRSTPRSCPCHVGLRSLFSPLGVRFCQSVQAHAPFDSNARHRDGTKPRSDGRRWQRPRRRILKDSGVHSLPQAASAWARLCPSNFAVASSKSKPPEADRRHATARLSDGLESTFVVTFPRPSADGLKLHTSFAKFLPSASFCALVVTDDNNKMLGSHW